MGKRLKIFAAGIVLLVLLFAAAGFFVADFFSSEYASAGLSDNLSGWAWADPEAVS